MMEFCSTPLWDLNRTWFTTDPDFTPCFHQTVLVYVPAAILWLWMPLQIKFCRESARIRNRVPWTVLGIMRVSLLGLLVLLSLVDLILELAKGSPDAASIVSPAVLTLTYALSLWLTTLTMRSGLVTSGIQFTFMSLAFFASTLTFISVVRFPYTWGNDQFVLYCIYYPVLVAAYFLHFWADPPPKYTDISHQVSNPSPHLTASFPNWLLFAWVDVIIRRGWKKPLTADDLFDLDPVHSCRQVNPIWDKHWEEQSNSKAKKQKRPRLSVIPTLCWTFGGYYLQASFLQLLQILFNQAGPNILSLLISFVTSGEETWKGYLYMMLLVGINVAKTILNSQYFYMKMIVGLRLRTAMISAIYTKSLKLSASSRKAKTVGETVNLMSIDTQRFMDVTDSLNTIWTSPTIIGLSLYFLFDYLGPACLSGLAVMVLLIPINAALSTWMRKFQFANMRLKDKRIKVMNEVLDGIKVLKLYAWEPSFGQKIKDIRNVEVDNLMKMSYLGSVQTFLFSSAPFLVAVSSFATFVLIDPVNNILNAERAFVSISYFNLMRMPLNQLPNLIVQLIQAQVSIKRVNDFMNAGEVRPESIGRDKSDGKAVIDMDNASFAWDREETDVTPEVKNVSIKVKKGDLVAVVGQVGAGKSSLLSALIGDMDKIDDAGRVNIDGSVAYVPQQAWIQNATLRYNVTFGMPYQEVRYQKVLDACAMRPDLEILDNGDMTEIGEKGINLSGGQKQRVSLARAIYSNRDIYLLDDPLSAVDSHVGKHIFENVISSSTGLLRHKTRVLVTNAVNYLPQMDVIVVMKNGTVSEIGNYEELLKRGEFSEYLLQHNKEEEEKEEGLGNRDVAAEEARKRKRSRAISEMSDLKEKKEASMPPRARKGMRPGRFKGQPHASVAEGGFGPKAKGGLMVTEKVETKAVKRAVYMKYAKSVGVCAVVAIFILQTFDQAFTIGTNLWLAKWSDDPNSAVPEVRDLYLGVYGALGSASAFMIMISSLLASIEGLRASSKLHSTMLDNVLRAPMAFFDTNPKGRVVNRFAKDVDYADRSIPMTFFFLIRLSYYVLGTILVISITNYWFILIIIPLSIAYWFIQRLYVTTSRQLRRLESISRSPIYTHFSETLSGVSTIRAYDLEARFCGENEFKIDANQVCYHPNITTNRWLSIRLEILGNIIVLFAALFAVLGRNVLDPGIVGLSLSYAMQITQALNMLIRQTSQIENNMVSIERIQEYQDELVQEAPYITPQDPDPLWPHFGNVRFNNYETRYREGLDLVLKGISCEIMRGEKIGIVGRTGAGKSSLTMALFRIIEASGGEIVIDDVNISQIGLGFLRSRLTIIPQDPVLFSGSLRSNLDPFEMHTDEEVWRALEHAHLQSFVSSLALGLQHEISEGGSNLSVGQKQLVCLARALLRNTKILILDEATAAVDLDTDDLIQATIRKEFANCTVITIAHRLNTVLDSSRVMVLSDGKIVEFDSPEVLLRDHNSVFYAMAKDAKVTGAFVDGN